MNTVKKIAEQPENPCPRGVIAEQTRDNIGLACHEFMAFIDSEGKGKDVDTWRIRKADGTKLVCGICAHAHSKDTIEDAEHESRRSFTNQDLLKFYQEDGVRQAFTIGHDADALVIDHIEELVFNFLLSKDLVQEEDRIGYKEDVA